MSSHKTQTFSELFFDSWYLQVAVSNDSILAAQWVTKPEDPSPLLPFAKQVKKWLHAYFTAHQKEHSFKLSIQGGEFRQKVYRALLASRCGDVLTYSELALRAGHPRAQRAVGSAMSHNNIAVFIPCHRVVTANKKLGGYSPDLEIKRRLLQLEAKPGV